MRVGNSHLTTPINRKNYVKIIVPYFSYFRGGLGVEKWGWSLLFLQGGIKHLY
jgi:hypothetical protein